MSRRRYLVSYDICDDKRLRRVAKICEAYGARLQYSVFECPLDDTRFQRLKAELEEEINRDQDQVMFVMLGPESGEVSLRIDTIGLPYVVRSRVSVI